MHNEQTAPQTQQPAPARLAGFHKNILEYPYAGLDPARGIMGCVALKNDGWMPRIVQKNGKIIGLNLANQAISDEVWAGIQAQNDLSHLEALNLRGNALTKVAGLAQFRKLRFLDLCDNQLTQVDIPPAQDLKHIFLRGNPDLTVPPPETVAQGRHEIVRFYQLLQEKGSERLFEAKVLILGAPGSGKTSLRRKLIQGFGAAMPTETESTHGLEVEDMHFDCHKKIEGKMEEHPFTAHIWDFGGQEIYHATHQFFLTNRSLYLIVADGRREDTDLSYWLQVIELFAGNSPVLVIQNEKSGQSVDMDADALKRQFPRILSVHTLDLKNDKTKFDLLKNEIEEQLTKLELVGSELPAPWVQVRQKLAQKLEKENTPYLSEEQYFTLCEKIIEEEEEALRASRFLHELGNILHFQNDPLLKHTVILDNNWATAGVYAVVDHAAIKEKKGPFTRGEAVGIWSDPNTPGFQPTFKRKADHLLQLMAKFEICYQLADEKETYLAPQLLPKKRAQHADNWGFSDNIRLQYQYRTMPKGLANRLVVRLHYLVENYQLDAWRSGAIFRRGDSALMLEENRIDQKIYLHARGKQARELMTIVTTELDRLNDTYRKDKRDTHNQPDFVEKMVPCICSECKTATHPYFFRYAVLQNAKDKDRETVQCQTSFEDVNITALTEKIFDHRHLEPDWESRKQRVRGFIGKSYTREALEEMKTWAGLPGWPTDAANSYLVIKAEWEQCERNSIRDNTDPEKLTRQKNHIHERLLELLGRDWE